MADSPSRPVFHSREAELQSELAVIVAYTQDEYIRKHGSEHGVAQEVAKAILAAGFVKMDKDWLSARDERIRQETLREMDATDEKLDDQLRDFDAWTDEQSQSGR